MSGVRSHYSAQVKGRVEDEVGKLSDEEDENEEEGEGEGEGAYDEDEDEDEEEEREDQRGRKRAKVRSNDYSLFTVNRIIRSIGTNAPRLTVSST